jgi:O-methyltransferase
MTTPDAVYALADAVRYTVAHAIPGAVVECGVWRGGSRMAVAKTLLEAGRFDVDLYLFDTFEGMSAPTDIDVCWTGERAGDLLARTPPDGHELVHLYPRLAPGGVLILDDYGWWRGAAEATDEYFREHPPAPLLVRVDDGGTRIAVKPT